MNSFYSRRRGMRFWFRLEQANAGSRFGSKAIRRLFFHPLYYSTPKRREQFCRRTLTNVYRFVTVALKKKPE